MKQRILVTVVCLPVLLAIILALPPIAFTVLMMALCAIGASELLKTTKLVENSVMLALAMVMAALVPLWSYFGCSYAAGLIGLTVFTVAVFSCILRWYDSVSVQGLCAMFFAGVIVPFFFSALVRLLRMENGKFLILVPLLIAFITDGGAYFAGRALGKHKLAPVISPKKTIEGLIGGYISAVVGMILYCVVVHTAFDLKVNYLMAILCALLGATVCVIGDLIFSVIKRKTGIKDYGKLLPGHGGVMDRFDSMITTAPVIEVLVLLLPLFG